MLQVASALLVAIVLAVAGYPSLANANGEAHVAAQAFVAKQRLGAGLQSMATGVVSRTQTYRILVERLGPEGARVAVSREVEALLPRFQPTWDRNLADAYARHFTREELESLASAGRASPYAGKVMERQALIGPEVQKASEPVLKELVQVALMAVFRRETK